MMKKNEECSSSTVRVSPACESGIKTIRAPFALELLTKNNVK